MAEDLFELTYKAKDLNDDLFDKIVNAVVEAVKKEADADKYVTAHRYGFKDMDDGLDALDKMYGEDALLACALYSPFFTKDPDYLYDVARLQIKYLEEMEIIDVPKVEKNRCGIVRLCDKADLHKTFRCKRCE